MHLNPQWVPMKWPCGPLEIARLKRLNATEDDLVHAAGAWVDPAALRFLDGTAVNCLILDWASGSDDDYAQQLALKPLIEAGRSHSISFVAKIAADAKVPENVTHARNAGFEAVILESAPQQSLDLPFILQFPSDHIQWETATEIFSTTGNVWPKANLKTMDENVDGDTAIAGPTANPWTDSNGWFSLLANQMASGKTLWLDIDPPETMEAGSSQDYCLAVADARVYGARWMISLDATVRAGLSRKDAGAIAIWTRIRETLEACESHPEWQTYDSMGILAVVSDFRGPNAYISGQVLNLLSRRQLQFTIVDRTLPLPHPSEWLRGVLWVDEQPPTSQQRAQLLEFAQNGGVVVVPQYWGPSGPTVYKQDWLFGYDLYDIGAGRMVVAEDGFPDPYQLSRDVHLLVSRKNDFVRLYNPGTTKYYSSIDSRRRKQLVRILNYSEESARYVTLWIDKPVRSARLWMSPSKAPLELASTKSGDGAGFELPHFPVLCAIEIERSV